MSSVTTEPPTLRSIPAFDLTAASLRRSYSCYICNYSFHITPTATTSSASPSSFRCPQCHHRHLLPYHTVSAAPPPPILPPPDNDYSPAATTFSNPTSDYSDSGEDYDSDNSISFLPDSYYYWNHSPHASKSFIDSLPIVKFPQISTPSAQSCPICMEDFEVNSDDSQTVNELPCKHYFHKNCIVEWLKRSNTCPLCRHIFPSDRSSEKDIDHGTTVFGVGDEPYDAILVVDFASVSEPPPRRNSEDESLESSNVAASGSDRLVLSAYGGEGSGWELDAMRDEDGDTLMVDA